MTEFFPPNFHSGTAMAVEANGTAFKSPEALSSTTSPNPKPKPSEIGKEEVVDHNNPSIADQGGDGSDSQDNKAPRLPRWTRQEILVLIEGKRVIESSGKKSRVIVDGQVNTESKWSSISSYCKRHGVSREPVQCRKRWSNLSGDYKKIRDWECSRRDLQSFWQMRNDVRREHKLPGFFDREVYNILDKLVGKQVLAKQSFGMPEAIFDSGRPSVVEEGLFSDFEHLAQENGVGSPDKDTMLETPTTAATPPLPGDGTEKMPSPNVEKGSASCAAGQKRRRSLFEVDSDSDVRDQLLSILERNSRVLTAHIQAQNLNCQLDRNQRKDHADSLVGVLGKLADALGRIADKL